LLAQLYFDSLGDKTTVKALKGALNHFQKQSQVLSEGQRLKLLAEAYDETMERIRGQQTGYCELAMKVLSWIVLSKKPLTTTELRHALAVEVGEPELDEDNFPYVEDMVSACAGLVTVNEESNMILLVHDTTREYFEQPHTQEKWFSRGHAEIATACVAYLSLNSLANTLSSHLYELDIRYEEEEIAYHHGGSRIGREAETWRYPLVVRDRFPLFF
jgi:hypothetical protein